jgi:hypothetical protein
MIKSLCKTCKHSEDNAVIDGRNYITCGLDNSKKWKVDMCILYKKTNDKP